MATVRPRNTRTPFEIHTDVVEQEEALEEEEVVIDESRGEMEGVEEEDEGEYSDAYSDDSDDVVDPKVQEDMDRFQETFKGIKERFRLINRIGEGNSFLVCSQSTILTRYRNIFYSLQG
jgi:cell division control protein 7